MRVACDHAGAPAVRLSIAAAKVILGTRLRQIYSQRSPTFAKKRQQKVMTIRASEARDLTPHRPVSGRNAANKEIF
jgi:hypothetical protein